MRGLLTPSEGGRYSGGWRRVYREWGDGLVLYHAGTNKRFYSVAWLAPGKGLDGPRCGEPLLRWN